MSVVLDYTLAIPQPQRHIINVTLRIEGLTGSETSLQLPAWTPGSYLLREYARHLRFVEARANGQALVIHKTDRLTWQVQTNGASTITVTYQVYGYELTVRTNHIDATHAHIVPAATLLYLPEYHDCTYNLRLELPNSWEIATGLPQLADGRYGTSDLDELMDCPFEVGELRRYRFEVVEKAHEVVVWGHGNEDIEQVLADTKQIVETEHAFWGDLPYDYYLFIVLLAGANTYGGLEHRNSTSLLLPRHVFKPSKTYERAQGLIAHEFFHTWNVKRLRAAPLGPFDYTRENYTRLLWVMEGFTEYYTDLMLVRAGLMTPQRYLERLADDITTLQNTPGRLVHSLSSSSFDAWIKFYRPDESTPNTTVSYYLKGGLAALVLDMQLRERSNGQQSLDDLIRYLYRTYPITGPGIPEADGMQQALQTLTGSDWSEYFANYIDGLSELPYAEAFATVGLQLQWTYKDRDSQGNPRPQLGARTKAVEGRVQITHVLDGGDADRAGLAAGDELIALDGWRIDEDGLNKRLADYPIGATVQLSFFRRDELLHLPVTFSQPNPDFLSLTLVSQPSASQRQQAAAWLGTPLFK
ncbi:PDZ domain-containing protein [Herpetosiphon gulosus]|uniref:PDZ domain-containing protein n=1 Tax=Herpetosiphon gulosus TaxID=1973496 RepID=A0ABP9X658_9CHLR